jgi:hypothetical protein
MVIPCTIAITTAPVGVFVSFLIPARKSKLEDDGTKISILSFRSTIRKGSSNDKASHSLESFFLRSGNRIDHCWDRMPTDR